MAQQQSTRVNEIQLFRPACSKCGGPTSLARIAPTDAADHDQRSYECKACGHVDTVMVKFK